MTRKVNTNSHPPSSKGTPRSTFYVYSLACDCDADRIIVDSRKKFYCAECATEMEKTPGAELPEWEQEQLEVKLQFRQKIAAAEAKAQADAEAFS